MTSSTVIGPRERLKIIVESKQESVSRTCEESEIKRGGNVWCSWRGTATLEEEGGEEDAVLVLKPLMFVVVSSFLVCGFVCTCWRFIFPRVEGERNKESRAESAERYERSTRYILNLSFIVVILVLLDPLSLSLTHSLSLY